MAFKFYAVAIAIGFLGLMSCGLGVFLIWLCFFNFTAVPASAWIMLGSVGVIGAILILGGVRLLLGVVTIIRDVLKD